MLDDLGSIIPYAGPAFALAALVTALSVYWDRKTKLDKIDRLSKELDRLSPADPKFDEARNVLASMRADAQGNWSIGSEGGGNGGSAGSGSDSGDS